MNCIALALFACLAVGNGKAGPAVIVVVGAAGTSEYESPFHRWAEQWRTAAEHGTAECTLIGQSPENGDADRDQLRETLARQSLDSPEPLWIVLIGHGTFDGREAKFNLRGSDVAATELAAWLAPFTRPVAVINCASSSGPFINALSGSHRVVVSATKSGHEQNYARFGEYLAQAISDPLADVDKDGQVSLLEAFLIASGRVGEFYRTDARLATEHALLDDNGDGLGTPAEWFRGVRATRQAKDGAHLDGVQAHQFHLIRSDREQRLSPEVRKRRNELELAVASLRGEKGQLPEEEYYGRLEKLLVELARLYSDSGTIRDSATSPTASPSGPTQSPSP